jgi:excisionase family DNA binding protein
MSYASLDELPPIITVREAADIARCSASTIHRAIKLGQIKATRAVNSGASPHRIRREDLLAWLNMGQA